MGAPAQKGFTLLEVLVALAVVATAMAALIKVAGENAANATYLRDRTLAQWIAADKVTELQVTRAWPTVGRSNGTVVQAGREWNWEVDVSDTPEQALRRLDISVRPAGDREAPPLALFTAFLGRPDAPETP